MFNPSEYQKAIFKWIKEGRGDAVLSAVAGSGKTTTIVEAAKFIYSTNVLFVAFNKHIVAELQARLPKSFTVSTIHSLGFRAVNRARKGVFLDAHKYSKPIKRHVDRISFAECLDRRERLSLADSLRDVVGLCRVTLTDPANTPAFLRMLDEFSVDLDTSLVHQVQTSVMDILDAGIETAFQYGAVDYNDMVWLPNRLDLPMAHRFDWVLADECFPYQTQVLLANGGTLPIGQIVEKKINALVYAYSEEHKEFRVCQVTDWRKVESVKPLVEVGISTRNHRGKLIETKFICTLDHKIFAENRWKEAKDLQLFDRVITADSNGEGEIFTTGGTVSSVKLLPSKAFKAVYDITVDDCHNFFANGTLVHNCQDFSASQQQLIFKSRASGGRIVYAGDERQAIMAFAGANARAFSELVSRPNTVRLPLSVCYRCPDSHLREARKYVPWIESRPGAPEGTIQHIHEDSLYSHVQEGDLVICRTTAPLISACLRLIAMDVPARVRGRDIGAGLVSIIKQVMQHPEYKWANFDKLLSEWLEWKITQLQKKENSEEAQQSAQDRVAAICAVHSSRDHKTAEALIAAVEELFSDQRASVWLSTVHRAKGLEAERVFILKPHKLPLVWTSQRPAQREQEINLKYVALTRAKSVLTFCYEEVPEGVKLIPALKNQNNSITKESEKV